MTHAKHQRGLTLIELLVSITIGIFIVGSALFVFQGVGSVGRQVNEVTQLRQQGATAFRLIGKQIREAGDIQPTFDTENTNYKFENNYSWGNGRTSSIGSWTGQQGVTKYISLTQQIPKSGTSEYLRDCLGLQVTASNKSSTFFLKDGKLSCATESMSNGQPIINNVHDMVVRYRVRDGASNSRFHDASGFTAWSKVDAIEVCLDLVGTRNTPAASENYENCEGQEVSRNGRLHFVQKSLFRVNPAGMS